MERLSTLLVVSCAVFVAGLTALRGARAVRSLPADAPTVSSVAPEPAPAVQPGCHHTSACPQVRGGRRCSHHPAAGNVKSGEVDLSLVTDYRPQRSGGFWTKAITKIWLRPPCCGACSIISQDDFRVLARVMATDSKETAETRKAWTATARPAGCHQEPGSGAVPRIPAAEGKGRCGR